MVSLVFVAGALGVGCLDDDGRHSDCVAGGASAYDVVDTAGWGVGGLPLWTTPGRVVDALGEPDSAHPGAPWDASPASARRDTTVSVVTLTWAPSGASYVFVGDTLALLAWGPLVEGRLLGTALEAGTPLADVRGLYPRSFRCRGHPVRRVPGDAGPVFLTLADTLRGATVALAFGEGGLEGVGVDWDRATSDALRRRPPPRGQSARE